LEMTMAESKFDPEEDLQIVTLVGYGTLTVAESCVLLRVQLARNESDRNKTVVIHIGMSPKQALQLASDLSVTAKSLVSPPPKPQSKVR
jgi:hypothetical protein